MINSEEKRKSNPSDWLILKVKRFRSFSGNILKGDYVGGERIVIAPVFGSGIIFSEVVN
jgi:hypothetical protein